MGRIGPVTADREVTGRHQARRLDQLREFFDGIGVVTSAGRHTDQQRPLGTVGALDFNLEDGQDSDSAVRLTGRAGTTVEMACL